MSVSLFASVLTPEISLLISFLTKMVSESRRILMEERHKRSNVPNRVGGASRTTKSNMKKHGAVDEVGKRANISPQAYCL